MRSVRIVRVTITHVIIFALLLRLAVAQSTNHSNLTSIETLEYNNLTNVTYKVSIVILVILFVFFLLSTIIFYHRRHNHHTNTTNSRTSRQMGLSKTIINTFPTFAYLEVKSHKVGKNMLECAVCLYEFEDDEMLRLIPICDHVFHLECIDSWLVAHTTCPVCRADLESDAINTCKLLRPDFTSGRDTVKSRTDEATTIKIDELVRTKLDGANTTTTKSPVKEMFYYSRLSKSHSTGHLLVRPRDSLDRFTLNLPIDVRNQIMNRAMNRENSDMVLPTEGCLRKGYRIGRSSGWTGRGIWNYDSGEGTSRFMGLVGSISVQKLGLRRN